MLETHDSIPHVESPYAGKRLRAGQHLAISAFWFATNFMWGALFAIVNPKELELIVPDRKAQVLGYFGFVALVALIVPIVTGALSDRCMHRWGRRRPFMLFGGAINLMGLAIMLFGATQRHLLMYIAGYCVVQIGNNIATGPYSGLIPDLVPEDQRGIASGYMGMMTQAGSLFGILSSGFLISKYPALTFGIIGAILTICLFISLYKIEELPLASKPKALNWSEYVKSLWIDPRKHPDFAWVWITRALVMLGFYTIQPFAQYFFSDVLGVPKQDAALKVGYFFALVLLAATISGYYGGALSDRIGRKKVVYVANSIIAAMAIALIFCNSLEQVLVVGVIFGLGFGAYISVDWALGTDVLPSKTSAAKDMAVWHISMVLPQAVTQPIAGLVLGGCISSVETDPITHEKITHYTHNGYAILFTMTAIYFLLGAVLLKNVKKAR